MIAKPGTVPTKIISAKPDSARQYADPIKMGRNLRTYRDLITQFTKREVLQRNPLTFIVNHFRRVLLWGQMPDWGEFLVITGGLFVVYMLG